jgi:hypothetical protein
MSSMAASSKDCGVRTEKAASLNFFSAFLSAIHRLLTTSALHSGKTPGNNFILFY